MNSPHDHLFKNVFSERTNAEGLLRHVLGALAGAVRWDTLTRVDGTFVDETLRQKQSDVLWSADVDGQLTLIYLLVEHRSYADVMLPLQLLAYVVRILTQWAKENPNAKSLPAVIPIVVHHGPKPWQTPVSLRDLIAVPTGPLGDAILALQPDFRFLLDDLARHSEAELRFREMSAVARLTLLFLQHIRSLPVDEALAAIERWRDLVEMVAVNPTGQAALFPLWSWLLRVTGVEPEQLREVAARISPSTEATVTNAADRLIAKGQAATLLRLLTRRFGPLPDEIVARIREGSPEDFDRWADRVLDANTLDDVFAA